MSSEDCPPPPSPSPSASASPAPSSLRRNRRPVPLSPSTIAPHTASSSSSAPSPSRSPKRQKTIKSPPASPLSRQLAPPASPRLTTASLENLWIRATVGELHSQPSTSTEPQTPTHSPLLLPRRLVTIPASASVSSACAILAAQGVLSAPVYDSASGMYLGLFDWRDVGAAVVKAALEEMPMVPHSPTVNRSRGPSPAGTPLLHGHSGTVHFSPAMSPVASNSLQSVPESLSTLHAEKVVDLSRKNPLYSVYKSSSMLHAMEFFARGIHRLLIAEEDDEKRHGEGAYVGVISQSDAVRFLNAVLKTTRDSILIDMKKSTIRDANIGSQTVVHISATKSVLEALQMMEESRVSSIAVLGERNEIQGNLSTTDIKYLFRKRMLSSLQEPCGQFINSIRQRQGLDNAGKDRSPYFSVSWDTTVEVTIGKMVATRAHRLWIVEQRKPVGVVSLSDILKFFTPQDSMHLWHPHFVPATEDLDADV